MQVSTQTSSFIDYICSDLLRGRVTVYLKDGNRYQYTNVSRRAILNLQLQPNISLGFWFNHNIIDDVRVNAQRSYLMSFWLRYDFPLYSFHLMTCLLYTSPSPRDA